MTTNWNTMDDRFLNESLMRLWPNGVPTTFGGETFHFNPCVDANDAFRALDLAMERNLILSWEVSDRTIRIAKTDGYEVAKDYHTKNRQIVIAQVLAEAVDHHFT